MTQDDLEQAALVHKFAFVRQGHSREWLECIFKAFPRNIIYVAQLDNQVVGYIIWTQRSGFRPEVVLELEQLAVHPDHQGQGIARKLITETLPMVKGELAKKNAVLKHVVVTTRADNFAQDLYKKTLGAEIEATISNLYSADEVYMVARNIP
ncbi:N-acetyltransferase [Vibrio alfacsensis]|uniref:N-acetyltransferase n=1 Tax=Vibrio alfacsensis TaxID=1074311 RepID=A0ABM6Z0D3_9VIBR|nr:GNAT family N-acetyltransferase [Vibrio alfacsensis]AXY03619.1 N-acetyltransferase [Vibrio alfacsensis]